MFLVVLLCCLSVCPSDYLKSNQRICMIFLPVVCHEPRNNRLHFWSDTDYDPDPDYYPDQIRISQICMKLLPEVCLVPRINPLNCGLRIRIINFDGGLHLTACLTLILSLLGLIVWGRSYGVV